MGFSRIFDNVWSGKRHAMLGPTQIDKYGQSNTSALGGTYEQPKVMMLGARGFPGNSISHPNSFFVPSHNTRVFMDGECDFVSSIGYNPARCPRGHSLDDIDIRLIDHRPVCDGFRRSGPPDSPGLIASWHYRGAGAGEARLIPSTCPATCPPPQAPTQAQLDVIAAWTRTTSEPQQIKDNPPGDRS